MSGRPKDTPRPYGPSPEVEAYMRGELTSQEYTRRLRARVDEEIRLEFPRLEGREPSWVTALLAAPFALAFVVGFVVGKLW